MKKQFPFIVCILVFFTIMSNAYGSKNKQNPLKLQNICDDWFYQDIVKTVEREKVEIDSVDDVERNVIQPLGSTYTEWLDQGEPTEPEFPGRWPALLVYLNENINQKLVDSTLQDEMETIVYVNFMVDMNGRVQNAKIRMGGYHALNEEAIRLVKEMPDWKPSELFGKKCSIKLTLPIHFSLN